MEVLHGPLDAGDIVDVVDGLMCGETAHHEDGQVVEHGGSAQDSVHSVERLLYVGAVEEEDVGVEVFDMLDERYG